MHTNIGMIASKEEAIAGGTLSGNLIRMFFFSRKLMISTHPMDTMIAVKIPLASRYVVGM